METHTPPQSSTMPSPARHRPWLRIVLIVVAVLAGLFVAGIAALSYAFSAYGL